MNNPDHNSESLGTNFLEVKILKFCDAGPGWKKFGSGMEKNLDPGFRMEKIHIFLTPQDGGEEEGEEPEYGEGEEELQEREQRAKQRQIMKEIRAKKVRCDSPIKIIFKLQKVNFLEKISVWRIRILLCGSGFWFQGSDCNILQNKYRNHTGISLDYFYLV
jgi:hypothetical protein